jgi:hypothetical protein
MPDETGNSLYACVLRLLSEASVNRYEVMSHQNFKKAGIYTPAELAGHHPGD